MSETTQIIRRRIRHWRTSLAGVAILAAPIALAIWPEQAPVIHRIVDALIGLGLISAADAARTPQT